MKEKLKAITHRIPERIYRGLRVLARRDQRSVREYTRVFFIRHVEEKLAEGVITEDDLEEVEEVKVGGTDGD